MTLYGYARVSTAGQDLDGQIDVLKSKGCLPDNIFSETFTGTTTSRPEFNRLLATLKAGDTLMIVKLDRFARNAKEALTIADDLRHKGITLDSLDIGRVDNTPQGKLIFNIFSAFADFERDLIVARTQAGKQYAKANNPDFREGRPGYSNKRIQLAWDMHVKDHKSYRQIAEETGISVPTLVRRFRAYRHNND